MIPYGKQYLNQYDINAVVEVLKSDYLTTGSKVQEFEEKFANYVGSKYAISVSSGTAALHLACLVSDIKSNDEVITRPMTFSASANCIEYVGGITVFADIKQSGNINSQEIRWQITKNTKVIIPVHYSGLPCNLEEIKKIALEYNLIIIEDGCHALGAEYKNSKIGSCKYSDMTVFSFHPVKHITTGEGGMITTNSEKLYRKLCVLRSHGIERYEDWFYDIKKLGFNYRLTDIQCGLGISQLDKLNGFIKTRKNIANKYNEAFKNLPIDLPICTNKYNNSYHLYVIKLHNNAKINRGELYLKLKEKGILCQVHYMPVHTFTYYQNKYNYKWNDFPVAEDYYNRCLSLPIYPTMSDKDINKVINSIQEILI
jgi:UDP-4-amino-4,6-dideoxy-N-acetyl-beta-L-altrosamine transaminase